MIIFDVAELPPCFWHYQQVAAAAAAAEAEWKKELIKKNVIIWFKITLSLLNRNTTMNKTV